MLIESASTRLAIDLIESLRKHKFIATDIRVSYIDKQGNLSFRTFSNLEEIKSLYESQYGKIVAARRNPFTTDIRKAQISPTVINGEIIGSQSEAINTSVIDGLCELGRFVSVERFRIVSEAFNYSMEFNCLDVSDILKIVEGRQRDIRRNSKRDSDVIRHKNAIIGFVDTYKKILTRLFRAYNANLYVDLCYVTIGYVEQSVLLYSIFFALVKERIDSGLRLSVLDRRYLKKID
jgi:hypothetical protein